MSYSWFELCRVLENKAENTFGKNIELDACSKKKVITRKILKKLGQYFEKRRNDVFKYLFV